MTEMKLRQIFQPASIALIGASRDAKSVGGAIFKNLFSSGFQGVIYPVNPNTQHIAGVKTYASVSDVEDEIDLAVIAVPRDAVLSVLEESAAKNVESAIVITAGFKEVGEEGAQKEKEIQELASEKGISLVGPNCLGVINADQDVQMNATFARFMPKSGRVSFLSQSGAVGVQSLEFAARNDIGFSKFISLGNKAQIQENEVLEFLRDDERTKVIIGYLENLSDPSRTIRLAREITRGEDAKPILFIKSGRTESGKRAASSHTGAMTERDEVFDFLFEQCGIIRAERLEELFDNALFLANQPIPRGKKLFIITNAGGPGIIAADEAGRNAFEVPEPSEKLTSKLEDVLPPTAGIRNPIDVVGDADAERYENALSAVIESGEADALLVLATPQMMTRLDAIARKICQFADAARDDGLSLLTSLVTAENTEGIRKLLDDEDIPNYQFAENGVRALGTALCFDEWRRKESSEIVEYDLDKERIEGVLETVAEADREFVTEPECYEIFRACGCDIAPYRVAEKKEDLQKVAEALSFPLVAKVVSPDIVHKYDVGGVKLALEDEKDMERAWKQIHQSTQKEEPDAQIEGILFQEMIEDGTEVILGASFSENLGHILMFGLGGTFVEVFHDVAFRIVPITAEDSRMMIERTRGHQILRGYRGNPERDIESLAEALRRLSHFLSEFPEIEEVDLNPVFAMDDGYQLADARMFLRS